LPQAPKGTRQSEDRVRLTLVGTVYTRPLNIAMGAIAGIITAITAAAVTADPVIALMAVLFAAIGLVRIALAITLPKLLAGRTRLLECIWDAGALSFSLATGILAAYAAAGNVPTEVLMLIECYAIGYATGIAARNAGRPKMTIAQVALALAPSSAILMLSDSTVLRVLGFTALLLIPAMAQITLGLYKVLRESIAAAETNARLAEKMQRIAQTDPVTGLRNRAGLSHHFSQFSSMLEEGKQLGLFWLDLDRFKTINDTLGHAIGDRVLVEVARRLVAAAPADAVVARFSSDEFILACLAADRAAIGALAEHLLEEIARPIRIDGHRLQIGASMGVAVMPDDGEDAESLMLGADLALYHAKLNGRNRLSFFHPDMTRELVRRREIETELRQALQRDELSVYFQPIIDLTTGKIRAFEALVRWFHPEKGELLPDEFIPVAEETGAIITLGNWITARAAKIAAQWPEDVALAVNLSPVQIRAPGAAMAILNALRDARLSPHRLELEITESVLLEHGPQTEEFIAQLAAAGVCFALDDFGTGYSSLSSLSKYQFGKIKVDRSFVSGVNAGEKSGAIIRATSEMAATLGMEIVAEGIETLDQVRAVSAAGCTLGQGYFFSRPVPDYLASLLLDEERQIHLPLSAAG
jgi:diguanylate cyclase (GGDEF)-like protein